MKHISQYSFEDNQKIKPIYTVFIKDNVLLLGFNDGNILPLQKECTMISVVEEQTICKCTILYHNPLKRKNSEWALEGYFQLFLNGELMRELLSFQIEETTFGIISEITFTVYCNIINCELPKHPII